MMPYYSLIGSATNQANTMNKTTFTLENADLKLQAAGYEVSQRSNDDRLLLAVTSEEDEDEAEDMRQHIQSIVGEQFVVAYTGDGNTDHRGISTDDISIRLADD